MKTGLRRDGFLRAAKCLALSLGFVFCLVAGPAPAAEMSDEAPNDDGMHEYHGDDWEYDPYYIFPLTRHMSDSELPLAGQIALYPFAFVIDVVQWPVGALAGLAGK
jgi:hypothetical protein